MRNDNDERQQRFDSAAPERFNRFAYGGWLVIALPLSAVFWFALARCVIG
jgi:hypothetical protein